MKSSFGNAMNMVDIARKPESLNNPNVKDAQRILKDLNSRKKEEIIELTNSLYDSVVKTNMEGGYFLENSTKVVANWDQNRGKDIVANFIKSVRGYKMTSNLLEWQNSLFNKIKMEKDAKQVYLFNDGMMDNFWVVVDSTSTDTMLKFSEIYMDFLDRHVNIVFDFMVFSEDEIQNYNFPVGINILNCED